MSSRWRSMAEAAWPLLQATAAATCAWLVARKLALDHTPFFAPIAAVVGLNAPFGERGKNTLRLLLGVFVGIIAAELTLLTLGGGYGRLALATFVAMAVARALGGARIVLAQAASAAILTLATADGVYGFHRLVDALIGAAVALGFSQVLFSPRPIGLVRRAEQLALAAIAAGLARTAEALEGDDPALDERALADMREMRDRLADLGQSMLQSPRVARHSAVWWADRSPLVAEGEHAGHLDLLGTSCLMLTRTALATVPPHRARVAATVRGLSDVLAEVAKDPTDQAVRRAAVEEVVAIDRRLAPEGAAPETTLTAALTCMRLVTADLLLFAGVAREPIAQGSTEEVRG